MTQDEFVRLMVESGLARYVQVEKTCVSNALQRFAALVAAHEREKQAEQEPVALLHLAEDALIYHTEQTRPIQNTIDVLAVIQKFKEKHK